MKLLMVLAAVVSCVVAQLPREWIHNDKSIVCAALGFRVRNANEPVRRYYFATIPMMCGPGTRFAMEVCTCIGDPSQVAAVRRRPYCQRLLNVTGTENLQTANNGHFISYSGNANTIFRNVEATCFRASYYTLHYLEANDFGNTMNLRFGVRFQNIANTVNNNEADTILIMTNGNCGRNQPPTFRIGYSPNNDSYTFVADLFFATCRMTPRRVNNNRNQIDNLDIRFNNGALNIAINTALINRASCTVNTGQNIFSNFNFKLRGTVCGLKIGNPGGRAADVCLSNTQLNRDCAAGM